MNLLNQLPLPVIFAHRGASAHAPENTLASFKLAEEDGAAAVELDVKLSLDGQVLVMHDPNTLRTTGVDKWIHRENYSDLRKLDAAHYLNGQFVFEPVPLLRDVFECLGKRLLINIELTNYNTPNDALVEKTATLVVNCSMQDNVLFSSFSPLNLLKVRRLLPDVPVGLLALEGKDGWLNRSWIGRIFFSAIIHPYYKDVSEEYVRREHRLKRRVHVWTVNGAQQVAAMIKHKVDGIFTDDPALTKQILEEG